MMKKSITVTLICVVILGVHFLTSVWSLGRYPLTFGDEPFFNYASVRYLSGLGLNYRMASDAPYGDSIWAYHDTLFPWFQVMNFSIFGASLLLCRLPQYIGAHIAVLLLCLFLIKTKKPGVAIALSVLWYGDRSTQEILYGRMEGLALLCLVLGFICLVNSLNSMKAMWCSLCGFFLVLSVGLNPTTMTFVFFSIISLFCITKRDHRNSAVLFFIAGGMIPVVLMAFAVNGRFREAIDQFIWTVKVARHIDFFHRCVNLVSLLKISKYWLFALVLMMLVNMHLLFLGYRKEGIGFFRSNIIDFSVFVFSISGFITLFGSTVLPYYLVYYSLWPVLNFLLLCNRYAKSRLYVLVSFVVLLCWLGSLFWNIMRFRDSVIEYSYLDSSGCSLVMSRKIPFNARIIGSHELYFIFLNSKVRLEPLPCWGKDVAVPDDAFLLLKEDDWKNATQIPSTELSRRPVLLHDFVFPNAHVNFRTPIVLLGLPTRAR